MRAIHFLCAFLVLMSHATAVAEHQRTVNIEPTDPPAPIGGGLENLSLPHPEADQRPPSANYSRGVATASPYASPAQDASKKRTAAGAPVNSFVPDINRIIGSVAGAGRAQAFELRVPPVAWVDLGKSAATSRNGDAQKAADALEQAAALRKVAGIQRQAAAAYLRDGDEAEKRVAVEKEKFAKKKEAEAQELERQAADWQRTQPSVQK